MKTREQELRGLLAMIIEALQYCEARYGYDDQVRLSAEAGLRALGDEKTDIDRTEASERFASDYTDLERPTIGEWLLKRGFEAGWDARGRI